MRRIFDISPAVSPRLAVWPGDTPPSREVLMDMRVGAHLTLSTLRTTVHVGAHADAPSHYGRDAAGIDEVPLSPYLGPCQVLSVTVARSTRIVPGDLPDEVRAARVLLRTGTHSDPEGFPTDFAAVSPEVVDVLADKGVTLIGIDTPSVDLFDDARLVAHRRCLARGVLILEGLRLDGVPDGIYELIALPLKLAGFDASPVRAVLRDWPAEAPAQL